mmetsp:Transcript_9764/g.19174  ORF Transcript_9764/g.19174 Transcript_9764/m.19174 type:complete len:981 (+) Transcript_9764:1019-3961(+)|eukprot:CAMPEP_0171488526 /NCGR_PEP_ID=MMETSP0958-20121227/2251_1 /TAXON_ID=87120 /ORGANISM="Aurantiochytrium limacinum, Strain ATCCMYA-1381" /LENGTH=980 /DNA_ID=CAMNT_0012021639 /DNA_START=554 /DNA_END=3496 /DNA_ORIENTATION=-
MGWLDNWRKLDSTVLEVPSGFQDCSTGRVEVRFNAGNARHKLYAEILCNEVKRRCRVKWFAVAEEKKPAVYEEEPNEEGSYVPPITVRSTPTIATIHLNVITSNLCYRNGEEEVVQDTKESDEGYAISTNTETNEVFICANRDRGLLYGVGRFMREMRMDFHLSYAKPLQSLCAYPSNLDIVSFPAYMMRQHQVAYRPKTNSYDAFTPAMMRQEVLDLALFGTNGIEMIPPGIDDAMQSPGFSVPWLQMLKIVSKWCDQLDINVSMWYPAFFKSYDTEENIQAAQEHWSCIMSNLERLDVLFVPGGDPGGRPANEFFNAVELQAKFIRERFFSQVQVWVSSQYGLSTSVDLGLTEPWVPLVQEQLWVEMLRTPRVQSFLNGVVYGPWSCVPIDEFRAQVPACLPLRNYPDLCHVQTSQMPCFGWDLSFAITNGRESINPRPREMAAIIEDQAQYTIGCGCYSEGVNDDVNKYVWTALHWGDDVRGPLRGSTTGEQLDAMLEQYASFLMDQPRNTSIIKEGIYQLESNWRGDLYTSESIVKSQAIFSKVQNSLAPRHRRNWRLNMLLFRAHHDAFMYTRLCQERTVEATAISTLEEADLCSTTALRRAAKLLEVPYYEPPITMSSFNSPSTPNPLMVTLLNESTASCTHLYGQLMALAATLYHQIGMQLSTGYGGQHRQRGAYFDLVWAPLGDVNTLHRVVQNLIEIDNNSSEYQDLIQGDTRDAHVLQRFKQSFREHTGQAPKKVVWYASFGDDNAHELPGCLEPPTRPIPIDQVVPPHHSVDDGQDPMYFTRCMVEYLDASNDEVIRDLHDGLVPRCWRSYLVPIWPRTARYSMRFAMESLMGVSLHELTLSPPQLTMRVTYLGNDINRHGGDWEELNRESQATRLFANGVRLHNFLEPQALTKMLEIEIPREAILRAIKNGTLILTWEPRVAHKTTFRFVPLPIAELWILKPNDAVVAVSYSSSSSSCSSSAMSVARL